MLASNERPWGYGQVRTPIAVDRAASPGMRLPAGERESGGPAQATATGTSSIASVSGPPRTLAREMDQHAARVRVHQETVAQEIDAILDSDPDADTFAQRMSDERPRNAEENLALVRGTHPRPTVMEKAERRREDIKAGVWRGKRRRGECRYCSQTYWFYPSRQKGHFCSQQCRTRFWNMRRGR